MSKKDVLNTSTENAGYMKEVPGSKKRISVQLQLSYPESLQEAIELFKDEYVFETFLGGFKIDAQGQVRPSLKALGDPENDATIQPRLQRLLDEWQPGVKKVRVGAPRVGDPVKEFSERMDFMGEEELDAYMAKMDEMRNQFLRRKEQLAQQQASLAPSATEPAASTAEQEQEQEQEHEQEQTESPPSEEPHTRRGRR